ncbi:Ig-like domain-containing protein [Streptomyces monticola]|uniref:Ig-like domain-containing protein n=1 Tax=Streptomyces monticola TaxID=2666263 RepID=A0ABW2JDZ9_9ACTN
MSETAAAGAGSWGKRPFTTGIESSGAHPVEFRFSPARNGNRRLFVVFANFAAPQDYGFSNGVLDELGANVLWIRDQFEGQRSYYLCKDMDFSLERSVQALIGNVMKALDLTPDDCTLMGVSKGGSAALYFGLTYGYRDVIAIAPQFAVGTYVHEIHPKVARFMTGGTPAPEAVRRLDALLPGTVRATAHKDTNVYLVSSVQDEQYTTQVEPFIGLFDDYDNFNFILSDSPFIADHTEVTRRNLPAVMGIAALLAEGVAPRLGQVRNGFEEPGRDTSGIDAFLTSTPLVREGFPAPTIVAPAPGRTVSDGAAIRFEGTAPGAVRVSLWEDGTFLANRPVGADGSWSWSPATLWGEGPHTVRVYAVDARGLQSPRTACGFRVAAGAGAAAQAAAA